MKNICILMISCLVTVIFSTGFAQEMKPAAKMSTFQNDLSKLRKKIIPMCAQLQGGNPGESKDRLLVDIDLIITEWKTITAAYKNNPPAEYVHDPAWSGYFDEALDNFEIMRARAEQGNYKRAIQFCGMNCGLFVNINLVNGVDKVSDKMFQLRKNVKLMLDMVKAGNWKGAADIQKTTDEMITAMMASSATEVSNKAEFEQDLTNIKTAYDAFVDAVVKRDIETAKDRFKNFLMVFGKAYLKYI